MRYKVFGPPYPGDSFPKLIKDQMSLIKTGPKRISFGDLCVGI